MKRYWFTFVLPPDVYGIGLGCGVTAHDLDDAIALLDAGIFHSRPRPPFQSIVEDIDIRTLDQGHVIPNMMPPNLRGIWYPALGLYKI